MSLMQILALFKVLYDNADGIKAIIEKLKEAWKNAAPGEVVALSMDQEVSLMASLQEEDSSAYVELREIFKMEKGPSASALGDGSFLRWLMENKDLIIFIIELIKK